MAKASFDFDYQVSAYDTDEEDLCKIISFKKGDKLPDALAIKFKIKGIQVDESVDEPNEEKPLENRKVNKVKVTKK